MRSEPHLPSELAEIENELRQLSLPSARVNREQLFYQAGWAAAQGSLKPASTMWPVTSGVLAAAVVVLAVMVARTPTTVQTVVEATAPAVEQTVAEPRVERPRPMYRHSAETAPLLAMRERALRGEFTEPTLAVLLPSDSPPRMTARELMQEFLPEAERSKSSSPAVFPAWPWQRMLERETI